MLQDQAAIRKKHLAFIEEVAAIERLWLLESEDGMATSVSSEFENEEGEPIGLICFWSNDKLARVCRNKHWPTYDVFEMPVVEFLEEWSFRLHKDGWMIGTNFDWNLHGKENDPLELAVELASQMIELSKDVLLERFNGLQDLRDQVKAFLDE